MALPTRVARAIASVDPFDGLQRDIEGLMGIFNRGLVGDTRASSSFPVDVREDADHLYVEAELPGFQKEDIDITLENQLLTISARREQKREEGNQGEWHLRERRTTSLMRAFNLPPTVDETNVDAKLSDGVLVITLNKREETKPRKIQLK
jgi:HSP20 family protein